MIHDAIIYAANAHNGQFRKGTRLPYIIHPMEVMQILTNIHAPKEVVVAGVLHDVLEDTPISYNELRDSFGDEIAKLVKECTNIRKGAWRERKAFIISKLEHSDINVSMLLCADKISNLRSIVFDLSTCGDMVWTRFSSTKENVVWYYQELGKKITNKKEMPSLLSQEYMYLLDTLNNITG